MSITHCTSWENEPVCLFFFFFNGIWVTWVAGIHLAEESEQQRNNKKKKRRKKKVRKDGTQRSPHTSHSLLVHWKGAASTGKESAHRSIVSFTCLSAEVAANPSQRHDRRGRHETKDGVHCPFAVAKGVGVENV